MDEQGREIASLSRQLEAAVTEARRVSEQARDKSSAKDRAMQTRILDLESQLSQAMAEIARVKREKEEVSYHASKCMKFMNETSRCIQVLLLMH